MQYDKLHTVIVAGISIQVFQKEGLLILSSQDVSRILGVSHSEIIEAIADFDIRPFVYIFDGGFLLHMGHVSLVFERLIFLAKGNIKLVFHNLVELNKALKNLSISEGLTQSKENKEVQKNVSKIIQVFLTPFEELLNVMETGKAEELLALVDNAINIWENKYISLASPSLEDMLKEFNQNMIKVIVDFVLREVPTVTEDVESALRNSILVSFEDLNKGDKNDISVL